MLHRSLCLALVLSACSVATARGDDEVLTNAGIIGLTEVGLSDELILQKIRTTPTKFDLSVDGLTKLKKAGVSEAVIGAMMGAPAPRPAPPTPTPSAKLTKRASAPLQAPSAPGLAPGPDAERGVYHVRDGETIRISGTKPDVAAPTG